jgi:hypothetical protein
MSQINIAIATNDNKGKIKLTAFITLISTLIATAVLAFLFADNPRA